MNKILIKKIEEILDYNFNDKKLLIEALTHKSKNVKDKLKNRISYEKLEFFGDRILGFIVSEKIYLDNQSCSEGEFNLILQKYVNENYLSKIALDLKINNFILTQEGDQLELKASILADVVESLIAGIYLDSNITECKKFIYNKVLKNNLKTTNLKKHPKSYLQEYSMKLFKSPPRYSLIKKLGPDHSPNFLVNVNVNDEFQTSAEGKNIQLAEENAAKKLISIMDISINK